MRKHRSNLGVLVSLFSLLVLLPLASCSEGSDTPTVFKATGLVKRTYYQSGRATTLEDFQIAPKHYPDDPWYYGICYGQLGHSAGGMELEEFEEFIQHSQNPAEERARDHPRSSGYVLQQMRRGFSTQHEHIEDELIFGWSWTKPEARGPDVSLPTLPFTKICFETCLQKDKNCMLEPSKKDDKHSEKAEVFRGSTFCLKSYDNPCNKMWMENHTYKMKLDRTHQ